MNTRLKILCIIYETDTGYSGENYAFFLSAIKIDVKRISFLTSFPVQAYIRTLVVCLQRTSCEYSRAYKHAKGTITNTASPCNING